MTVTLRTRDTAAPARAPRVRRRPEGLTSHAVLLTTLSALALGACAKVGEDVFSRETAPFDEPIRAWIQRRRSTGGDTGFLISTRAGGPSVVIPMSMAIGA